MKKAREPRNLLEAIRYFSDPQVAFDFVVSLRWPTGKPVCPYCGCLEHSFLTTRRIWKCMMCRRQFSVKVGTVFEGSPLGFDKWLPAMWLIVNSKNGVSSHELGRALGVTQKTAWFMNHRIRLAMRTGSFTLMNGEVEVDETFVGGLAKFMHKDAREKLHGTGGVDKTIVVGVLQRSSDDKTSRVHAEVTADRKRATLHALIGANIQKGAVVYTDAHAPYVGIDEAYEHAIVDHAIEYVRGRVHTNGIESFWNLLKRGIKGTYTHVDPEHLNRYLDERCFTFNERKAGDFGRMCIAMSGIAGRQMTYAKLIGK